MLLTIKMLGWEEILQPGHKKTRGRAFIGDPLAVLTVVMKITMKQLFHFLDFSLWSLALEGRLPATPKDLSLISE